MDAWHTLIMRFMRNGKKVRQNAGPASVEQGDPSTYYEVTGALEMHPNGYGFGVLQAEYGIKFVLYLVNRELLILRRKV